MDHHKVIGSREIISQNPRALTNPQAEVLYLPILLNIMNAIEQATGHKWRTTSYVRQSPSHQHGISLDIAPDMTDDAKDMYAAENNSDPVLYKREGLIRPLQSVAHKFSVPNHDAGIFIEPDHLHLQLFTTPNARGRLSVVKWGVAKLCYSDTKERMTLPLII